MNPDMTNFAPPTIQKPTEELNDLVALGLTLVLPEEKDKWTKTAYATGEYFPSVVKSLVQIMQALSKGAKPVQALQLLGELHAFGYTPETLLEVLRNVHPRGVELSMLWKDLQ
jgi:hypothetical protein